MCQSLPDYSWIKLEICASLKMNIKKILLCWLIVTIKYFVVNVAVAGVLDILVFRPLEAWLGMEDVEDVEDMEDMEDMEEVENMEDPMGIDTGSVVTKG